jgi:hypothetical protein
MYLEIPGDNGRIAPEWLRPVANAAAGRRMMPSIESHFGPSPRRSPSPTVSVPLRTICVLSCPAHGELRRGLQASPDRRAAPRCLSDSADSFPLKSTERCARNRVFRSVDGVLPSAVSLNGGFGVHRRPEITLNSGIPTRWRSTGDSFQLDSSATNARDSRTTGSPPNSGLSKTRIS